MLTFSQGAGNNADGNTDCVMVTINMDNFVECDEDFTLSIIFTAGQTNDGIISITNAMSTVTIEDAGSTRKIFLNQIAITLLFSLAASFAIESTANVGEDAGIVSVCTTISMAAGVTLQKEVILDVASADGSGESMLLTLFT